MNINIYIGIGLFILLLLLIFFYFKNKTEIKTEIKTETKIIKGCNLGYEMKNDVCEFIYCPIGYYNDINEKKCKKREKDCSSSSRTCETVSYNPNSDDCIIDSSKCCSENKFSYNNECFDICPPGTITNISNKTCVRGSCAQGFYRTTTDKGGEYRDNIGLCKNYNNAFSMYENYLSDINKQCKNVTFNPNEDSIIITNKNNGTNCSISEIGTDAKCQNGICTKVGCKNGFYDRGDGICINDCKNNTNDTTRIINNKVNNTCVSNCPINSYYNKIMNGNNIEKNECVSNCNNISSTNFFDEQKELFNYKPNNTSHGYCISCRQDLRYSKIVGSLENDIAIDNARKSYQNVYNIQPITSASYSNFYNNNCLKFN